jgi:hypothetical protein
MISHIIFNFSMAAVGAPVVVVGSLQPTPCRGTRKESTTGWNSSKRARQGILIVIYLPGLEGGVGAWGGVGKNSSIRAHCRAICARSRCRPIFFATAANSFGDGVATS